MMPKPRRSMKTVMKMMTSGDKGISGASGASGASSASSAVPRRLALWCRRCGAGLAIEPERQGKVVDRVRQAHDCQRDMADRELPDQPREGEGPERAETIREAAQCFGPRRIHVAQRHEHENGKAKENGGTGFRGELQQEEIDDHEVPV